jgi:hypothetical protein
MSWWQPILDGLVIILIFLWDLFKEWIWLFLAPVKNWDILWIIIPIWINFIFTEIFQEKKGTGLGNAVTNGAVLLWVGIDWIRHLFRLITEKNEPFSLLLLSKFIICFLVLVLGIYIIFHGIKGKKYISFIGRVREISYITLMFSPIIYGISALSWQVLIAILIYFPFFYFTIEFLDRVTPTPKTYNLSKDDSLGFNDLGFGSSNSLDGSLDKFDPFESSGQPQNTKKNNFKF